MTIALSDVTAISLVSLINSFHVENIEGASDIRILNKLSITIFLLGTFKKKMEKKILLITIAQ